LNFQKWEVLPFEIPVANMLLENMYMELRTSLLGKQ